MILHQFHLLPSWICLGFLGVPSARCAAKEEHMSTATCQTENVGHSHMGVSLNGGTPKWMVYNGKPYYNGWFGDTIIFGNTHIYFDEMKHNIAISPSRKLTCPPKRKPFSKGHESSSSHRFLRGYVSFQWGVYRLKESFGRESRKIE